MSHPLRDAPAMLTPEQISHFKLHGYVVLRGAIEPVYIDAWRRAFWRSIGGVEGDPASWRDKPYVMDNFSLPYELMLESHPKVRAVIHQLGGGNFTGGGTGRPLVHWPNASTNWAITPHGHLDGYYPGDWSPFMVACTACAYDVEPMGGGFIYWPGSHLTTHRYFLENPEQVDGRFRDVPNFNWGEDNIFTRLAPRPQEEFTGTAGDVIFWHAYMVHTGSTNIRNVPRVGFFGRYHHKDQQTKFRYEIPTNLWKYWAV
ncbi:MAG: hypothetical protein K8S99_04620 [Planctomycetes bacterium]|nr:hypothetical protein [Planctomycetota bacterium]